MAPFKIFPNFYCVWSCLVPLSLKKGFAIFQNMNSRNLLFAIWDGFVLLHHVASFPKYCMVYLVCKMSDYWENSWFTIIQNVCSPKLFFSFHAKEKWKWSFPEKIQIECCSNICKSKNGVHRTTVRSVKLPLNIEC